MDFPYFSETLVKQWRSRKIFNRLNLSNLFFILFFFFFSFWITGEYEYIDVVIENKEGNPTRLIVDIDFKSQFELARPTQYYKELNDSLPVIFVGTEDKLCKIISLLCSAAKQSLREKGLHVPPWRTTAYMQSKWLCVYNKEEIVGRESTNCMGSKGGDIVNKWVPPTPILKSKKRDLSGGSALSSQFSTMGINCC